MSEPLRVLLVEDSEDDAMLILRELRRRGFAPEHQRVDSEGDLMTSLENGRWDIVISDFSMPSFDGLKALGLVQSSGKDLPFIIVSGNIGEDVAVDAMRSGAHDYVMKDNLARLGPAVQRELGEAEERRARRRADEAYRNLVESSLQGLVILQDEMIVFANAAAADIFGYTVDELISLSPQAVRLLVHPADRVDEFRRHRHCLEGKKVPPRYEVRMQRADGAAIWVEVFLKSIDFGGRPALQAAMMDVTERVRHQREQMAMVTMATSLRAVDSRAEMMPLVLEQVIDLLDADGAVLASRDQTSGETELELACGSWSEMVGGRIPSGEGITDIIFTTGKPYLCNDVSREPRFARPGILNVTRAVAGAPLIDQDQVIGVLWMGRNTDIPEDDLRVLTAIAEMTASALRRVTVLEELKVSHEELELAYESTLEGWARALELRDQETEGHTRRVTEMTLRLACALGTSREDLVHVRRGAVLHDIGKMAIPDRILLKEGPLTDDERVVIQQHPVYAYEMLSPIIHLRPALDIPYCHHEWWDGSGYPQGLKGEEIPVAARIFAVVDVWDALRSDRPYRSAWPPERVSEYISRQAGIQFEPKVVHAFLEILGAG